MKLKLFIAGAGSVLLLSAFMVIDGGVTLPGSTPALSDTSRKQNKKRAYYSPQTIAALKACASLNKRGDTALYFQHVGNKTWYFVQHGKGIAWYNYKASLKEGVNLHQPTYKMGLIGSDKQVLIPARYDILHNISGSFPNLIEAELNDKRGFFDLNGKAVLPVIYDEVFPLADGSARAVLRQGDNYYWWQNNGQVKADAALRIDAVLPHIKGYKKQTIDKDYPKGALAELADAKSFYAVYMPPSYLVDWNLKNPIEYFDNPNRRAPQDDKNETFIFEDNHKPDYVTEKKQSWLSAIFYSITNGYLGGRSGLYKQNAVLVADTKRNRIHTGVFPGSYMRRGNQDLDASCDVYNIKPVNDSLYEVKFGKVQYLLLPSKRVFNGALSYNYLILRNQKFEVAKSPRVFAFTQLVKMNDSYLQSCYMINNRIANGFDAELLEYMRNEILADNGKPVPTQWKRYFRSMLENDKRPKSMSAIDKYNLDFIDKKLTEAETLVAKKE